MRKKLFNWVLPLLTLCCSSSLFAQMNLGVHASNYAGVNGIDFQPASFVDGRFRYDMTLFGVNGGFWNNAVYFDTKNMPAGWKKSFINADQDSATIVNDQYSTNDWLADPNFESNNFFQTYDTATKKPLGIYQNLQLDLFNIAFHLNRKSSLGLFVKTREIFNVQNLDPQLAYLAQYELNVPSLWNRKFNEELLRVNAMAWNEFGVNYARVLKDDGEHFMKAGASLKLLAGLASAYVYTGDMDYGLNNADTTFYLKGKFNYGYNGNIDDVINATEFKMNMLFQNLGFGADLGYVYEWRPDYQNYKYEMDNVQNIWRRSQNKYKLRAGVSILDIGGIRFDKGIYTKDMTVNEDNPFDLNYFSDANSFTDFDKKLDTLSVNDPTDWTKDPNSKPSYYMNTPTSLGLSVDYNIWKIFYVNSSANLSLNRAKDLHAVRVPNQFSITPSVDWSWAGLHLPASYNRYSGFKQGVGVRLGPLTLGWLDVRSLLAKGKIYGGQFYFNLRVPVLYGEPDDRDGDKISDKIDECKDIPGVWAFKGCPDRDMDGIPDSEDLCPDDKGLAQFKGCPDRDNDSIIDKDDACPDLAGIRAFNGCPDRDNDSIIDPEDECPDTPGIIAFKGCPDTDGDGIKDADDACPEVAGPIENQGCPDTDNDGIFDFVDNCPTEAGPKENNGCPWPDTDKDGLIDKDDDCPYLAGPIKNKGCPYQDTDNDGVLDKDDDCPTVAGPVDNKGCPRLAKEEEEVLKTAFENLEFNTGNAIIKEVSYPSLDELAALLVKKKNWKLQISGHTDNVGDAQKNLVLSKQRAEAVKAYLVSKGVEAARLNTLFFGETQPIATNDTPEGRQKNRRVEMTVIFQ